MKSIEQLINNVIGQLEGVKRMLKEERECLDVLIQLKAVKAGVNLVTNKIIEEKTLDCLSGDKEIDKEKIQNLIKEIVGNN